MFNFEALQPILIGLGMLSLYCMLSVKVKETYFWKKFNLAQI